MASASHDKARPLYRATIEPHAVLLTGEGGSGGVGVGDMESGGRDEEEKKISYFPERKFLTNSSWCQNCLNFRFGQCIKKEHSNLYF